LTKSLVQKDSDDGSAFDSDEEDIFETMFKSSLKTGSYFLKVEPEEAIVFRSKSDRQSLEAKIYLENTAADSNVAFYVFS
jgi:hypothetical protein